jgi:hypothetical protein
VRLINLDGLTLIGPGSEWFWAALSGIILAVTFMAIYRQLRLQAHSQAVEQVNGFVKEWGSERMSRFVLDVMVALQAGTAPMALPEVAVDEICSFWERIGTLTRAGHLDLALFAEWNPNLPQVAWLICEPWTRMSRARSGDPRGNVNFEWLAGVMAAVDRQAGVPAVGWDWITSSTDRWVAGLRERLQVEEALRAVRYLGPEAARLSPEA